MVEGGERGPMWWRAGKGAPGELPQVIGHISGSVARNSRHRASLLLFLSLLQSTLRPHKAPKHARTQVHAAVAAAREREAGRAELVTRMYDALQQCSKVWTGLLLYRIDFFV